MVSYMKWARFEKDGMSYWLNGAQPYVKKKLPKKLPKKLAAHKYVETYMETSAPERMKELGQRCADTDNMKLEELYGLERVRAMSSNNIKSCTVRQHKCR